MRARISDTANNAMVLALLEAIVIHSDRRTCMSGQALGAVGWACDGAATIAGMLAG
jgi:hypothetical protein